MQILDGKNHARGAYEKFIGLAIVDYLNGQGHWGWLDIPRADVPLDSETVERANTVFLETARQLVDQWIATGIDHLGLERPSQRRARASVDEPPIPLFDILHDWLGRHMPKPALMNDGRIAILEQRPNPFKADAVDYARDMAIYYFKELLESSARYRIGRCKNPSCGKYFVRRRKTSKEIKRGTYCGVCQLVGSAERTKLSRQKRKNKQLEVAAEAWRRAETTRIRGNRANWIASQVNRSFQRWPPIQGKWVNQNKRRILEMVDAPSS